VYTSSIRSQTVRHTNHTLAVFLPSNEGHRAAFAFSVEGHSWARRASLSLETSPRSQSPQEKIHLWYSLLRPSFPSLLFSPLPSPSFSSPSLPFLSPSSLPLSSPSPSSFSLLFLFLLLLCLLPVHSQAFSHFEDLLLPILRDPTNVGSKQAISPIWVYLS